MRLSRAEMEERCRKFVELWPGLVDFGKNWLQFDPSPAGLGQLMFLRVNCAYGRRWLDFTAPVAGQCLTTAWLRALMHGKAQQHEAMQVATAAAVYKPTLRASGASRKRQQAGVPEGSSLPNLTPSPQSVQSSIHGNRRSRLVTPRTLITQRNASGIQSFPENQFAQRISGRKTCVAPGAHLHPPGFVVPSA